VVLEFTTYSLSPYDSDEDAIGPQSKLSATARAMTAAQVSTVRDCLRFIAVDAKDAVSRRPFIAAALDGVWRPIEGLPLSGRP